MKLYLAGSFETHLFERRKQYAVAASTPIATLAADAKFPNDFSTPLHQLQVTALQWHNYAAFISEILDHDDQKTRQIESHRSAKSPFPVDAERAWL